jgi:hypothetical protein
MTKETPAFVCPHVFQRTRPVLFVSRDGGDWHFLCGGGHPNEEKPRVVGLNHLMESDPTLQQLEDLPVEWEAERVSIDAPWARREISSA